MSQTANFNAELSPMPPECNQVMLRLQSVLDGELPATVLEDDPHPATCRACRERIAVAKLVWSSLRVVHEAPRTKLTEQIVEAIQADRKTQHKTGVRRRVLAAGLAIAAGLLVVVWKGGWLAEPSQKQPIETANQAPVAPASQSAATAQQAPIRLGDELTKAEHAFVNSSRPITEPAKVAPQVLEKLTDMLTRPSDPEPQFEFARTSLFELPDAARSGLQPVTDTTQKALVRLFHDVSAIQTTPKPN